MAIQFLSTLPARGATAKRTPNTVSAIQFLSTLPARGATDAWSKIHKQGLISIHAPREGSDNNFATSSFPIWYFYPRSPRGERPIGWGRFVTSSDFYPRSPRGERLLYRHYIGFQTFISIHAPREGSDLFELAFGDQCAEFLSTLPARGATAGQQVAIYQFVISIHAPREGSDRPCRGLVLRAREISIHAPREGSDRTVFLSGSLMHTFLSTLPARGATFTIYPISDWEKNFYPRSPRGERRKVPMGCILGFRNFYPRSPRGERRCNGCCKTCNKRFLSTLPARGATALPLKISISPEHFYPRSPRGERRTARFRLRRGFSFLSTLPARGATFLAVRGY